MRETVSGNEEFAMSRGSIVGKLWVKSGDGSERFWTSEIESWISLSVSMGKSWEGRIQKLVMSHQENGQDPEQVHRKRSQWEGEGFEQCVSRRWEG